MSNLRYVSKYFISPNLKLIFIKFSCLTFRKLFVLFFFYKLKIRLKLLSFISHLFEFVIAKLIHCGWRVTQAQENFWNSTEIFFHLFLFTFFSFLVKSFFFFFFHKNGKEIYSFFMALDLILTDTQCRRWLRMRLNKNKLRILIWAFFGLTDSESNPLPVTRGNRHCTEAGIAASRSFAPTSILGL